MHDDIHKKNKKSGDDASELSHEVEEVEIDETHKKCDQEKEEYKQKYLRALADYQNLDRRAREDRETNIERGKVQTVVALLPILDSIEQAEVFVSDPGLKIVKEQFVTALQKIGVTEIEVQDKQYDPLTAEVIEMVPSDEDGIVVDVVRKGYMMNNRIIRIAHVKVGKNITS